MSEVVEERPIEIVVVTRVIRRAKCPVCGRMIGLLKGDRFAYHVLDREVYPNNRCPGTSRKAA
jgi:hypothetical protein